MPVSNSNISSTSPAINPQVGPKIKPTNIIGICDNPTLSEGNPNNGIIQENNDNTKLSATNKLTITTVLIFISGLSHLKDINPIKRIRHPVRI